MSFNVSADAYLRFMGRYSEPLAAQFADLAGVRDGQRVLDVGCGPGALAAELVNRAGAGAVSAVEPSASFVAAARDRLPGVDIRQSAAEQLPFPDTGFDAALAQLVIHFMADPVTGLREMGRVTRTGGVVAACVWDHAGGRGPLSAFWRAVRELDPGADDESGLAGVREGHLAQLFAQAGARSRSPRSTSRCARPDSRRGGRRSRSASARRERTWRPCPPTAGMSCASGADGSFRPAPSTSALLRGRRPARPDPDSAAHRT